MDHALAFDMIYALAACGGREAALFGSCIERAREAFAHSLVNEEFPELWFELPLMGEPWFDLHALASEETLSPETHFVDERTGGYPEVFRWFASQGESVRQLALSWDVGKGDVVRPAIQLLVNTRNQQVTCDFLTVAGRPDAAPAYRAFLASIPEGWYACYAGVFPDRPEHNLRIECIPNISLQRAYAESPALLEAHLRQVGLNELGDTLVARCRDMAQTPFRLEFQFDVDPEGRADETFSASVRFAQPSSEDSGNAFELQGPAGDLMSQVEAWGLADSRWRLLADTMFAKRVTRGDESNLLYCYPAFCKLRWRAGVPLDAKAYLIAGIN